MAVLPWLKWYIFCCSENERKKDSKDQETIQSSTIPNPGQPHGEVTKNK